MDEKKVKEAYAEIAKTDKRALAELIVEYIQPKHISGHRGYVPKH